MPPSVQSLLERKRTEAINEWVFPHYMNPNEPLHPDSAYKKLKTLLKHAELPLIRFDEIKGYEGDVLIVHGTADKIVAKHYAEEAEGVYMAREQGSVQLHFIEGGKHMFSKKHDKIAIEYLEKFVRNDDR